MTEIPGREAPKAFVIAERLKEWNTQVFEKYGPLALASIERFGGRYLALSNQVESLEGPPPPLAMAVIEFPSLELAQAWYASSEYQSAAKIRREGAENRFTLLCAGVSGPLAAQAEQKEVRS